MDINGDVHMAQLTNVKCEIVIRSFRWKDDVQAYAFTGFKRRLDVSKIRRFDLNLWNLGTELSRV